MAKLFKKKFKYSKPHDYIRYSILFITIFISIAGSFLLINLLEPYSIFARTIANIIKPIVYNSLNQIILFLKNYKIYLTQFYSIHHIDLFLLFPVITIILIIMALSVARGRFYCNVICPVGSILGFISRFSILNIRLDAEKCKSCGRCEKVCRAECIDNADRYVDLSRCVGCYDCLDICSFNAIKYKLSQKNNIVDSSKRNFMKTGLFSLALSGGLLGIPLRIITKGKINYTPNDKRLITPPGSAGINNMTNLCTACHLCVANCPTKVLTPGILDYGLSGIFQPKMNYEYSFCDFECNICTQICPTGAIKPLAREIKKKTKIGEINLSLEKCIVITNNTACGACAEICPTTAVYMTPYKDNLTIPKTEISACIGCGACEYACPAKPKAIFISGLKNHTTAIERIHEDKNVNIKTDEGEPTENQFTENSNDNKKENEKKGSSEEDFPF